ncbi:carbohydrate deacetylase [Kroppenstedtia guangzhouensis]|jgi:chitin disaccharide deacetylase|uniref:Carbohydrate deacetylase n=1 Tax=Kroppenstedtia guangzhouensis TaxID=1274356 RepID=A0ABQ1GST5_9BACL|nr:chitin disaccharide deacetylase [Kroppenstedtia guangzhouensis]GGA49166.1 carbohydrate deacetylase [Kroppenstedtia guangzhouensis]
MTQLIINADDFGYSKGVNLGILESFKNGVVTSTTLMTNMPCAEHAAKLAREHPELGVGIHLVLTCGSPLCKDVPSLVDDQGVFRSRRELEKVAEPDHIERELTRQVEAFFSLGLKPTHLDSHHHVHSHGKVAPIVLKLAKQYRLPIRKVSDDPLHSTNREVRTTDLFLSDFYGDGVTKNGFLQVLERGAAVETAEIMCHPAYLDHNLLTGSSYSLPRAKELVILTDPEIKDWIRTQGLKLISYREWKV